MLAHLLGSPIVVGANVRGAELPGGWLAALPELRPAAVAVAGEMDRATLASLVALVPEVRRVAASAAGTGPHDPHDASGLTLADVPAGSLAAAVTGPGCLVLAVRPPVGEPRSAVPVGASGVAAGAALARMSGLGPAVVVPAAVPRRLAPLAAGALERIRGLRPPGGERRIVVTGEPDVVDGRPPVWLRLLAAERGVDLEDWGWAVSAPGAYTTRKVLVVLVPPGAAEPALVVKVTRDPSVNRRLDNARRGLEALAALGPPIADHVPHVAFAGSVAGLSVVAESALSGRPLARREGGRAAVAKAVEVVDVLAGLAVASRVTVDGTTAGAALTDLVGRYAALYATTPDERAALEEDVAALTAGGALDAVTLHGDPGTHNILDGPAGVVVLDWENHEAAGLPLWDVLAFLRTWVADGTRRRLPVRRSTVVNAAFVRALGDDGPVRDLVRRYCRGAGVPDELGPPLTRLAWVYQAVKEAPRLAPGRTDRGVSVDVVRRLLAPDATARLRATFDHGG